MQAKRGDRLEHGFVVERVLGQGATATALLVTKDEKEFVLKVALTEEQNARLHEEAEALRSLHSEFIVAIEDELVISGRTVLVLQKAGDKTLAALLRSEGVPGLEMLARYGDDLLSAVSSLERHGVAHRDIKPDNIGIRSLTKQRNQLILFDFSLASAPLDNIRVGTPGYTDPFLAHRKPRRWDLAAERYSAAVTLYEMTLGAGVLPQWGDGKSDPAMTDAELAIDAEKFDPSVREGLVEFFRKALHRDPGQRFHNADEMRWAWQQVFQEAEQRKIKTPGGEEVDLRVSLEQADLTTPVAALGLSTRARNALERADILTVRNLLEYPIGDIHLMRGVGNQTRREIIDFVSQLRGRFPNVEAAPHQGPARTGRALGTAQPRSCWSTGSSGSRSRRRTPSGASAPPCSGLTAAESQPPEPLAQPDGHRRRPGHLPCPCRPDRDGGPEPLEQRPVDHPVPPRTLRADPAARRGRHDPRDHRPDDPAAARHRARSDAARQQRLASAVARAAVETEDLDGQSPVPAPPGRRARWSSPARRNWRRSPRSSGRRRTSWRRADPLPPPLRVFQELYEVSQPQQPHGCQPFGNERLLEARRGHEQDRRRLVPPGTLPPWHGGGAGPAAGHRGAVAGWAWATARTGFTIEQIRDRLRSRYPEAEPLPDRPELDALLHRVGLDVRWDAETKTYHRRDAHDPRHVGLVDRRGVGPTATSTRKVEVTPGHGRGPPVRGAAAARLRRRRVPGAHRPPQPDAARARTNSCGGSSWSGSRSTTCSSTPCARRPRNWRSTGRSSSRPTGRTAPARTGTTCCTSSRGWPRRSPPTCATARSTCCWSIRG